MKYNILLVLYNLRCQYLLDELRSLYTYELKLSWEYKLF